MWYIACTKCRGGRMNDDKITCLRMERQHFANKADEAEYREMFRDMSPCYQVYWIGFGQPPVLKYRAQFDDSEYNRARMRARSIIIGRFIGGNLAWIEREDMPLFAALYKKPLTKNAYAARELFELIEHVGPLGVRQIKEESGLLVKEITPALKQLQEAFLVFEDRYDNNFDRSFYLFSEMFPDSGKAISRDEALETLLKRFAYRNIVIDEKQAKAFYKLPAAEIKSAFTRLVESGTFTATDGGYMLSSDAEFLRSYIPKPVHFVYAINRNDFLFRSYAHILVPKFKPLYENLPYDSEPFHYILVDGVFRGVSVGHVHNGPFEINDIVLDMSDEVAQLRKKEIIDAVTEINLSVPPRRFMGKNI